VRALYHVKAPHRLVVIGDDQTAHARDCRRLAAKLGVQDRVEFLGKKNNRETLELLSTRGHVLVTPSQWDEPFSIVVLEGMGIGLPVLASNTGGTGEAIVHGVNGFLFGRGRSKELAGLIDQLEGDRSLCRRIGARARQDVLERFTMERMVDQILSNLTGTAAPAQKIAA
jgi:glycosyltransferase involved in cell wall biosynthesis